MLVAMGDEPSLMTACLPGFLASFVFAQVRSQLFRGQAILRHLARVARGAEGHGGRRWRALCLDE